MSTAARAKSIVSRFSSAVLLFLFVFSLFLGSAPKAHAQVEYLQPNTESNVPKNLGTFTQSLFIEVNNMLLCQLLGTNPLKPEEKCLAINSSNGQIGFSENSGGLVKVTTDMIAVLYTPPASTSDYIRYMVSDFGIVKKSYAAPGDQGFGFSSISPLVGIWSVFRNLVYLLFVIIFIIIGISIMLRVKMDPKTAMSIENQIPKVIVTLVMVTLSFGISGLLIDLMWLSTYVSINVISSADPNPNGLQKQFVNINNNLYTPPVGFANEVLKDAPNPGSMPFVGGASHGILKLAVWGGGSIKDIVTSIITPSQTSDYIKTGVTGTERGCSFWDIVCHFGNAILGMFMWTIGTVVGLVFGALAVIVFIVALLVALLKLWVELLKAYIYLLLDIVLAPLWFLASLLPGSTLTIESWFREVLAELVAFPVAISFILLGKAIMSSFASGAAPVPVPLIGAPGSADTLSALIGIGVILMVPQVVTMTKQLFKAPEFKYTQAIGQSIGAGTSVVGNQVGSIRKRLFKVDSHGGYGGVLGEMWSSKLSHPFARFLTGARKHQTPYAQHLESDHHS